MTVLILCRFLRFSIVSGQFSLESENISGVSVMDQLVANGMDVTFSQ